MRASLLLPLLAIAGCTTAGDGDLPDCTGDRCAAAGSRDELLDALDGFSDPVARYLRAAATERGTIDGDLHALLDGASGGELGCAADTERTFVVLSNLDFLPKPVIARCADDPAAASELLITMVGSHDGYDPRAFHVAAWDADAGVYRRYATAPTPGGEMAINVEPAFCQGCHGGPEKLATWAPIMNEVTSPWSGWNAAPGFTSQLFDELLDPQLAADPTYVALTAPGRLDSAANLEPIVRAGIARVTGARLKQRTAAADVAQALALVRPMFCDESINFVSEVHDTGELRTSAVVDDALRSLYRMVDVDGGWGWLADPRLPLAPPRPGEDPVTLIPVRGEATAQVELGLVGRGVIDARDALRVRALDWTHPVGSALRCGLYRAAADRIVAGALADDAAAAATTADLVPRVLDEILTVEVAGARVALRARPGLDLIQIPDASDPAAAAALATGDWSNFETTLAGLGAAIDAHVAAVDRAALRRERDRRACEIAAGYPTAPIYLGVECP